MGIQSSALVWSLAGALALCLFVIVRLALAYADNLKFQQQHDSLTDLPNRLGLEAALAKFLTKDDKPVAVLFLGLDEFRQINDLYGHRVGDLFLQQTAHRIRAGLNRGDLLARVGGDEFVVVTRHPAPEQTARNILDAVIKNRASVPASLGLSLCPAHSRDPLTLIRQADLAMRHTKLHSGGAFTVFHPEMSETEFRRGEIVTLIRSALDAGCLHLVFQPVLDRAGAIAQMEALVRIQDVILGSIPPDEFLGVAEQTGLIHEIGNWIFKAACQQARQWRDAGHPVPIAVNVSPVQLEGPDFTDTLLAILASYELPPSSLVIEITGNDGDAAVSHLRRLRAAGLTISADDFSVGAPHRLVRDLPIDYIKIDGSLTAGVSADQRLIAETVRRAHQLNYQVVFERIEEPWQHEFARQSGGDLFQGYLIAPPLEAEDATRFLLQNAGSVYGARCAGASSFAASASPFTSHAAPTFKARPVR
jgi:diguanylate cyclase (GGDEF)-like protein